ncbi:MAG TPA: glycosyltransferase [Thermoflexales bacterium]|nr:glycosyltransferase [Thermoflexales bacterium]
MSAGTNLSLSLLLPTLNGGPDLDHLLTALAGQVDEIIIADSESADDTPAIARKHGAKVITIPRVGFSHSGTRNILGDAARGELLLFMTQDALPSSDHWLADLRAKLQKNPRIAAVSCAQLPRPDADLFARITGFHHRRFMQIEQHDRILRKPIRKTYEHWRRNSELADSACLIRKSIWQKYHFQREFGEDIDLGLRLIRDGHHLALMRSAAIIHSHNRSPIYQAKRAYVSTKLLLDLFPDCPVPRVTEQTLQRDILPVWEAIQQSQTPSYAQNETLAPLMAHMRRMAETWKQHEPHDQFTAQDWAEFEQKALASRVGLCLAAFPILQGGSGAERDSLRQLDAQLRSGV